MLSFHNQSTYQEDLADLQKLRKEQDYQEGLMATDDMLVYLGSKNNQRKLKKHLEDHQTIDYYRNKLECLGKVLNPEERGESWTYTKNQAFMLGAIEAQKTFILVTPKSEYNKSFITTVIDELLWLNDNGYKFSDGKDNTLICTPPARKRITPIIRNYYNGEGIYNKVSMNQARNDIFGFIPRTYIPSYMIPSRTALVPPMPSRQIIEVKKVDMKEKNENDGWIMVNRRKGKCKTAGSVR